MTKDILLSCQQLTTKLKRGDSTLTIVYKLSFDLARGKSLVLVGESGAGKTVALLSLLKLLPTPPFLPSEGKVLFHGQNLLTLPEANLRRIRGKEIAMIFQDPKSAFNPVFTIGEQLKESALLHLNISEKEAEALSFSVLEEVFLPEPKKIFRSYPHELSGGMLQRAMIAMALLPSPSILMADEPTTALDVTIQAQILDLLCKLKEKRQLAILLITHDLGVALEVGDNTAVLFGGEMVEEGNLFHLFDSPAHPYTRELFAFRSFCPKTEKKEIEERAALPIKGCRFSHRCPYKMKICSEKKPPFFVTKEKAQLARCFLFDPDLKDKLEEGASF